MTDRGAMGFVAAAAWVALSAGLFQLFQRYDWEEGMEGYSGSISSSAAAIYRPATVWHG
jgi:hypothetical protein